MSTIILLAIVGIVEVLITGIVYHQVVNGSSIDEADKALDKAINEANSQANKLLNMASSAGSNATQAALTPFNMTNVTNKNFERLNDTANALIENIKNADNTDFETTNNTMNKILHSFANELRLETEQRIRDNPNMTFDECMRPIDTSPITCMKFFNVNETEMEVWEVNKRIEEAAK
jgi:hypothetical protein